MPFWRFVRLSRSPRSVSLGKARPGSRAVYVVLGLALASFVLALVVADELFPLMSANNDEAVYVFQAEVFRGGHLSLPADSYREVFQPWMSNEHDGRLVLVFQPVFPAVLALSDLLFGSMRVALGLIAAGCVILVALLGRELRFTTRTCVMAAALFALSPFAVFQSALYLEYLFAVLLELAVLTLFFRGRGRAGPVRARLLAAAGLVFGLLVFTRPLEALMLGAALALYLAAAERRIAGAVRNLWWPALGSLPAILGMLLYNAQLTGNPLRFPLWAIGGNNAFGFGKRHVVDTAPIIDATALNALKALHQNLRSLPHWMFGSLLIVPLAFWGLWLRQPRQHHGSARSDRRALSAGLCLLLGQPAHRERPQADRTPLLHGRHDPDGDVRCGGP